MAENPAGTRVDLNALAQEEVGLRAVSDRIAAHVRVPAVPLEILGSGSRSCSQLARVLGNLLDNSQGHASSTVPVELRADGANAMLTVTDDGHGVATCDRERVFERFVRLDEARTRDDGGAGLGLAIARDVVQRQRGTLAVGEGPGGGAAFRVTLPRAFH
uniref:sensor histidine kinase n=1 Tax=Streptomyces alanosinicus TaxID=68171 RepID=UPI001E51EB30|nr:ATP-binding protein [Streptomyces alanosinicus]